MLTTVPELPPPRSVSIVVPVMNGMPWIREAIASIQSQAQEAVEVIVLDGGSNDGTREWLLGADLSDARLVFEADRGQADAIAKGFRLASGDVLGWLNADDLLEPQALARVLAAFAETPGASAVSGACWTIDTSGQVVGRIDPPPLGTLDGLLHHPTNLAQPATFVRAAAYARTDGIDSNLEYAMDVDLWLKLARIAPVRILPREVLASFRVHPATKTTRAAGAMAREDLRVRIRHGLPIISRTSLTLARRGYLRPIKMRVRRCVHPSERL